MAHPRRIVGPRKGLALVTSLAALVLVSVIIAGVFTLTDNESRSSTNRTAALRATQLTEAGLAHAMALLRGSTLLRDTSFTRLLKGFDNATSTSDDGYLIGFSGLGSSLEIRDTGRVITEGRYFVRLIDDPADTDGNPLTDMNNRIIARCRGVTADGAVAEIDAILGPSPMPAVVVDGSLTLNGNPELLGACGGAHANGSINVSGTTTVTTAGLLTSTGTTTVSGGIEDTTGASVPPVSNQPPIEIPDLNPMDFCAAGADYMMQPDGYIRRVSDNTLHDARSVEKFGFKRASVTPIVWDQAGADPAGTYCALPVIVAGVVTATANLKIGSNVGSAATPAVVTFLVSGAVEVSGNPYMVPDHAGIMIMAGGDLSVSGNPSSGSFSYSGLLYGGAQCKLSGNLAIMGQLVCKEKPNPLGANDYAGSNTAISGNSSISYNCTGSSILTNRRVLYWYPRIGS